MTKLKEKIHEALTSVLPITFIVFLLSITLTPMPIDMIVLFIVGAIMLIVGMGLFSLGAELSMMPMGNSIGHALVKYKKTALLLILLFIIGCIITIAEPDLTVLAHQVPAVPDKILIWTVAAGVGLFLMMACLRIIYHIDLKILLIVFYTLIFLLAYVSIDSFIAVAFDSGGVTTGPITVPFLMALGVGLSNFHQKHNEEDSFGMVALCSIGPILAVLLLGFLYQPKDAYYTPFTMTEVANTQEIVKTFLVEIPAYIKEVALALFPIICFFMIFQIITRDFKKRNLIRIMMGTGYTFFGLVLFLCGVNVGFMPAGYFIGASLAKLSYNWILIPIGMVIGFSIVKAEPAVHVLNRQVEEISSGAIAEKAMLYALSFGVAISLGIAMLRVLTGIPIMYFLIPAYVLALSFTFFVPKVFIGIAFDSGGVVSGPMTATFLLPFTIGACEALNGNVLMDAFGIVALVAMTPLITIQLLGLFMNRKAKQTTLIMEEHDEIISFKEDE